MGRRRVSSLPSGSGLGTSLDRWNQRNAPGGVAGRRGSALSAAGGTGVKTDRSAVPGCRRGRAGGRVDGAELGRSDSDSMDGEALPEWGVAGDRAVLILGGGGLTEAGVGRPAWRGWWCGLARARLGSAVMTLVVTGAER